MHYLQFLCVCFSSIVLDLHDETCSEMADLLTDSWMANICLSFFMNFALGHHSCILNTLQQLALELKCLFFNNCLKNMLIGIKKRGSDNDQFQPVYHETESREVVKHNLPFTAPTNHEWSVTPYIQHEASVYCPVKPYPTLNQRRSLDLLIV